MKVYISADIEGVAGSSSGSEGDRSHADFAEFREQMTSEVAAACEGALEAGATDILVKDAHGSARNIIASRLPREARLTRGWSGHPFLMVEGLDSTFGALIMVGYHSSAGSGANPLAHTITGSIFRIALNGAPASELLLHAYAAASVSVPLVFVSGDAGICAEAAALDRRITTVAVKEGLGASVTSIHPTLALERIRQGVKQALGNVTAQSPVALPQAFVLDLEFRDHAKALAASFYPGIEQLGARTLRFRSASYFEVLRTLAFILR